MINWLLLDMDEFQDFPPVFMADARSWVAHLEKVPPSKREVRSALEVLFDAVQRMDKLDGNITFYEDDDVDGCDVVVTQTHSDWHMWLGVAITPSATSKRPRVRAYFACITDSGQFIYQGSAIDDLGEGVLRDCRSRLVPIYRQHNLTTGFREVTRRLPLDHFMLLPAC